MAQPATGNDHIRIGLLMDMAITEKQSTSRNVPQEVLVPISHIASCSILNRMARKHDPHEPKNYLEFPFVYASLAAPFTRESTRASQRLLRRPTRKTSSSGLSRRSATRTFRFKHHARNTTATHARTRRAVTQRPLSSE